MGGSSKKQKIGYKIYLGVHMIFTHGPIDAWLRLQFDRKTAWEGFSTGGTINIAAEDLFGGEEREGGVSGAVDLEMGEDTQGRNAYLQSMRGAAIPAYRGVTGAVFNKFYWGMNPYLKMVSAKLKRIHRTTDGAVQWYDGKAEIMTAGGEAIAYDLFLSPNLYRGGPANPSGQYIIEADPSDVITLIPSPKPEAWSRYAVESGPGISGTRAWQAGWYVTVDGSATLAFFETDPTIEGGVWYFEHDDAIALRATQSVVNLTGHSTYGLHYNDEALDENRGGLSWTILKNATSNGDMNPAHIIRECLVDPDWGMGYLPEDIDEPSFMAAADTLWAEGMGMSLLWDRQMLIEDFIKEVIRHINAALFVSRDTGLFKLKLIRNDYDIDALPILGVDEIERIEGYSLTAPGELVNSVTVNYWDAEANETGSVTETDPALVIMEGAMIGTTIQYPGFTHRVLASRVALRDLHTLSVPSRSCTIYANRAAEDLNIGDPFKLNWPDYGSAPIVMRVLGMALGDGKSNKIRLQVTQDQFAMPVDSAIVPPSTGWTDPIEPPVPVANRVVVEAPYVELLQAFGQSALDSMLTTEENAGFVVASGARPMSSAINMKVATDAGAGFEVVGDTDFCPMFTLTADIPKDPNVVDFPVDVGIDPGLLVVGMHGKINDEEVEVVTIAAGLLTVKRAVLDTVPGEHVEGDVLLFWDAFAQGDPTQYVDSESVDVKLLTASGRGTLALADAPTDTVVMASRAIRPYPPGQFKIDDEYYPLTAFGDIVVTWVHRDRVLQADELVGTLEAGVGPEAGTTYTVRYYADDVLVHTSSAIAGLTDTYTPVDNNVTFRVELEAVRDGYVSWQMHSHEFHYTIDPTGLDRITEASDKRITEASDQRITE